MTTTTTTSSVSTTSTANTAINYIIRAKGGGSVTARCIPEVNITSPPIDVPLQFTTTLQQQQQQPSSFAQQQLQCAKQFFSGKKNTNTNSNQNNNHSNKNGININNNNSNSNQKSSNKKYFLLRSKQTNTIFSSGCTLVEEEDFNELTAVPTTTILIATNTDCGSSSSSNKNNNNNNNNKNNHDIVENNNNKKIRSRHLPPLKLTSITTPNIITIKKPITPTDAARNKQTIVAKITPTITTTTTTLPTKISPTREVNLKSQIFITSSPTATPLGDITPINRQIDSTPLDETTTLTLASSTITADCVENSTQITTNTNTTITTTTNIPSYSRNTTTTRSWPVIYRNPQYYDYEALYVQASKQIKQQQKEREEYLLAEQKAIAPQNQFAQSILYSSSNEDLTAFNEYLNDNDNYYVDNGAGVGGLNNYNYGDAIGQNNYNNNGQQTTCYYFSSSRRNSIYEHPSAITTTSSAAGATASASNTTTFNGEQESLRRGSNNLYLRNNSYKKHHNPNNKYHNGKGVLINSNNKINKISDLEINDIDDNSPTSLNSAMDGGSSSNNNNNTCCSSCCLGPPPVLYLFITLLMTTSATAMLCAAIMSDHWEHVIWDRNSLDRYTNRSKLDLEWLMDDKVAMLKTEKKDHRMRRDSVFLVPMHGGIWTLCIDLPLHELQELRRHAKFPRSAPPCVNYLANSMENARGEEQRNDWQHSESQSSLQPHLRMQNLSISCSLVCLIILGSAALVGAFGVCQRQISAILITGVMYLLAATFALFTLMIIHFKRQQGRPMLDSDYDGTVDGIVARPGGAIIAKPLLGARIFLTSWSLDLGWGGVVLCAIASMLWIFLSKIMRYNPLSLLLI